MDANRDISSQSSPMITSRRSRSLLSIGSSASLDHQESHPDPGTLRVGECESEDEHSHSIQEAGEYEDDRKDGAFVHENERSRPNSAGGNDRHQQGRGKSIISKVFYDWWLLELSGMILSIAAIAAIVGVLTRYHNQPLQEWPYHITINTLISFLNSLAKGAMLLVAASTVSQLKWLWFHQSSARSLYDIQIFDDASRGPLGALQLLMHTPRMSLTSFSALVIVLSFGMDPFTQQILSYPQRSVRGGYAAVGTAQGYAGSSTSFYSANGDVDEDSLGNLPEASMLRAIYAGTFGDPSKLDYQCPSGNCTWPTFSSLAFCTQCNNGTGQGEVNSQKGTATYVSQSNITWSFPYPVSPDTSNVGIFVPSNVSSAVAGIHNPLMGFAHFPQVMFSSDPTFDSTGTVGGPTAAVECALYFCVNTYHFGVNNGLSNLDILSTYYDKEGLVGMYGNVTISSTKMFSLSPPDGNVPASGTSVYSFNPRSLFEYFQGQLTSSGSSSRADLLSQLSLADNVTGMMTNIGLSMTSALMNEGNQTQMGTETDEVVFINVHWPWLILPAGLVLSTSVLLFLVMARSSRNKIMIWKSSALALVFHGPNLSDRDDVQAHRVTEMEIKAKRTKVEMLSSGEDWKFIQKSTSSL